MGQKLVSKARLLEFDALADIPEFLGRAGVTKKRLILDAKASGISGVAFKFARILPRILDVAEHVLRLQAHLHAAMVSSSSWTSRTLSDSSHCRLASENGPRAGSTANI